MILLSLECSASPVSVALSENGNIISNDFSREKVTHSQTLMPMILDVLKKGGKTFSDIDAVAVAAGPGSFTGIRIGIAAAKGIAAPKDIPCFAVSTLEAMAYMFKSESAVICPVMDARCSQLYNGLFKVESGKITRLCEDRAIKCEDLSKELCEKYANETIIVCGDGMDVFEPFINSCENIRLADENKRFQNATGVACAAENMALGGKSVSYKELVPVYLRLPQAERELKAKKEKLK